MPIVHQPRAPKKATNLSINGELLREAKQLHINLSATLEQALAEAIRDARRQHWLAASKGAIEAYNARVESEGVFSDGLRSF